MGWLLAALLGGVLTFNSAVTPGKAAQKAEEALEKRFPGAEIEVEIEGKRGMDVLNGKFKRVHIEISNVTLTEIPFDSEAAEGKLGHADEIELELKNVVWENIPLESAEFKLEDVDYDLGALKNSRFRFAKLGSGHAKISLQDSVLGKVVSNRLTDVSEAHVEMTNGQFHVTGKRVLLGMGAPFKLTATPEPAGASIYLRNAKVHVGVLPVPEPVIHVLLGQVNPIYSFDEQQLPFRFVIRQVDARESRLRIGAELTLKSAS